jgi:hypothetical protein
VVGKVADWIYERLYRIPYTYNEYLASQTAGLFRPGVTTAHECEYMCEVGDLFGIDGGFWEVKRVDGDVVMCGKIGEDDGEEDWEVGETD